MDRLRAGAGKAAIQYTTEMLPIGGENYRGIHDLPFLSVVILEAEERFALIAVDVVLLDIKKQMEERACELLKVDAAHLFIHAAHVITGDSPENEEFGNEEASCCHFTRYSLDYARSHGNPDAQIASEICIRTMNPMYYIDDPAADTTSHWRIRHGERDRDTSLAISTILTVKLVMTGASVDYQSPWERPHSGDYDLEELFAWIDGLVSSRA